MEYLTGSYAQCTMLRPVTDQNLVIISSPLGSGKTTAAIHLLTRLTKQLNRYYDKSSKKFVEGRAGQLKLRRQDIVAAAAQAMTISGIRESGRRIVVSIPQQTNVDFIPAFVQHITVPVAIPTVLPTWAPHRGMLVLCDNPEVALHVPPEQLASGATALAVRPRRQARMHRQLARRALVLLRRILHVKARRVYVTVVKTAQIDHSAESHRSRAPGGGALSSHTLRTLATA